MLGTLWNGANYRRVSFNHFAKNIIDLSLTEKNTKHIARGPYVLVSQRSLAMLQTDAQVPMPSGLCVTSLDEER